MLSKLLVSLDGSSPFDSLRHADPSGAIECTIGVPRSSIHTVLDTGRIPPQAFVEMIQWPIEQQPCLPQLASRLFKHVCNEVDASDNATPVIGFDRFIGVCLLLFAVKKSFSSIESSYIYIASLMVLLQLLSLFHPDTPIHAKATRMLHHSVALVFSMT
jgi:hypothetical protein